MKPSPQIDYSIVVRDRRVDEHGHAHVEIFAGIYDIILNHQPVSISFVPSVFDSADEWPPQPPDDMDALATSASARLAVISLADYVVTPSDKRAGDFERLTISLDEPRTVGVFFVAETDFAQFAAELEVLGREVYALNKGKPISKLREHRVIRFVHELVLSEHFRPEDRNLVTPEQPKPELAAHLATSFVFEIGSPYAPDSPFGSNRLRVLRDGTFEYENQLGDSIMSRRKGQLTASALRELGAAIRESRFPKVPKHDILPGSRNLRISTDTAQQAVIGLDAAPQYRGYDQIAALISEWTTILRSGSDPPPTALRLDSD